MTSDNHAGSAVEPNMLNTETALSIFGGTESPWGHTYRAY